MDIIDSFSEDCACLQVNYFSRFFGGIVCLVALIFVYIFLCIIYEGKVPCLFLDGTNICLLTLQSFIENWIPHFLYQAQTKLCKDIMWNRRKITLSGLSGRYRGSGPMHSA